MHLPAQIGDYTDFYAGIHHATNVGKQFRPDNPLLPNYKYVPIGYHGRASSIGVIGHAGAAAERPAQAGEPRRRRASGPAAVSTTSWSSAIWIGAGNAQGEPIPIGEAADHIAGFCLLNDWSARDIQAWEYQPLGPFLAKNFAHHDLALGRHAGGAGAVPQSPSRRGPRAIRRRWPICSTQRDQARGALDLELEVLLLTAGMREAAGAASARRAAMRGTCTGPWRRWSRTTPATAATSQPGDLFGTGTISGPDAGRLRQPAGDHRGRHASRSRLPPARSGASWRTATR